jgi:hypothetical protein
MTQSFDINPLSPTIDKIPQVHEEETHEEGNYQEILEMDYQSILVLFETSNLLSPSDDKLWKSLLERDFGPRLVRKVEFANKEKVDQNPQSESFYFTAYKTNHNYQDKMRKIESIVANINEIFQKSGKDEALKFALEIKNIDERDIALKCIVSNVLDRRCNERDLIEAFNVAYKISDVCTRVYCLNNIVTKCLLSRDENILLLAKKIALEIPDMEIGDQCLVKIAERSLAEHNFILAETAAEKIHDEMLKSGFFSKMVEEYKKKRNDFLAERIARKIPNVQMRVLHLQAIAGIYRQTGYESDAERILSEISGHPKLVNEEKKVDQS